MSVKQAEDLGSMLAELTSWVPGQNAVKDVLKDLSDKALAPLAHDRYDPFLGRQHVRYSLADDDTMQGIAGLGILGTGAAGLGGAAYGANKMLRQKKEASAELFYKLGAFTAVRSVRTKLAEVDIEELLAGMGLGAGVGGGMGAVGAGLFSDRGPQRRDLAEGLQGKDRSALRRILEHAVNPAGASAFAQGKKMREQKAFGGKEEHAAKGMQESYDTSPVSKIIRGLQLGVSPLALLISPLSAGPHALMRLVHSASMNARAGKEEAGDLHTNTLKRMGAGGLAGAAGGGLMGTGLPGARVVQSLLGGVVPGMTLGDRLRESAGKPMEPLK